MVFTELQISQALTDYLQSELNQKQMAITAETSLIAASLIDSLTIFKLILFIEEHFAIKIQPEDIVVENFETINSLQALVKRKL